MREIVLDTETTGLDPQAGHRLVEVGCVELVNRVPTGKHFQIYLNPERDIPEEALRVHGLSEAFLRNQPLFSAKAEELLAFIGDAPIIAHNAEFDLNFLNWELGLLGFGPFDKGRVIDTLALARQKFPGGQASLDALCKRFNIDNSSRNLHGALLDAQLLAEVYLELTGGRQTVLGLGESEILLDVMTQPSLPPSQIRPPRAHAPSAEELAAHTLFIAGITGAIWAKE